MNLKQHLVSALGWSVGIKLIFQIVTWIMTLVVIRLLAPGDYGLMAVSQVFLNFMLGFSNLGLGDALVQRDDTPPSLVASVFGVLILISIGLTALLAVAAYPIAAWYGDPRLIPLIQVSSLGFLFNGLTTLPRMFLLKSLNVRPMFVMELSSGLVGAITVLMLARNGYGVWALVIGWLATNIVKLGGFAFMTSEYYVWPNFNVRAAGPLYGYGIYRTLEYTAWTVMISADVLIIGRVLGSDALGFYTVALNFACVPLNKIAPIVNAVAFPAFALLQGEPSQARFYLLKAVRMVAALAVPVFFGISVTAPEIVNLVFGPQWAEAKPLLAILSLAITVRAILIPLPNYLQGIGDARSGFWCTASGALIFPPAILIGCHWGITGACYAWLLGYPLVFLINAAVAVRSGHMEVSAVLAAPLRPMLAGVAMAGGVMAVRSFLPPDLSDIARFACLSAIGAAIYGAIMLLAFRQIVVEFIGLSRRDRPSPA